MGDERLERGLDLADDGKIRDIGPAEVAYIRRELINLAGSRNSRTLAVEDGDERLAAEREDRVVVRQDLGDPAGKRRKVARPQRMSTTPFSGATS
jgi:hypothetical protein